MGMMRGAIDKTNSMKDVVVVAGRAGILGLGGDRPVPAAGHECR